MNTNLIQIEQIWSEIHEDIHRFVCSRMDHQDHCHDIVQDVFIKIAGDGKAFEGVENIKAYVVRVASNTINDHFRKTRPVQPENDNITEELPQIEDHTKYLSNEFLHKTIAALADPYREAIIKIEIDGMSQKEYAQYANISFSGAKSRVQRARVKLKEQILACCAYGFDKYGNMVSCCGQEIGGSRCG